jgi:predicted secreted protein
MPGKAAFGAIVQFGTTTGTATTATLSNVTNISGLDGETETIDVTSHDSGGAYREKVASFLDLGQVTLDYNFDPNEATHRATSGGVIWLKDQRILAPWVIKFPGSPSHKVAFQAYVTGTPFELPYDDKQSGQVVLETSGSATWTYGT